MKRPVPCSKSTDRRGRARAALLSIGLGLVALVSGCGKSGEETGSDAEAVPVTRGRLRVSVLEGGDLESANPVSVRSELEGRGAILALVPEGVQVKKGDFLVRLDSASIQDNLNRQEIKLEDARNALAQAEEAVQIQVKKNKEDETSASTDRDLAKRALDGFLEGTKPLEELKLKSKLTIAEEKLKRAKDKAEASLRLSEKEYISKSELEADELAQKQAEEEVKIAEQDLAHYQNYKAIDDKTKFSTDVEVKELALARVIQQASSELKQKQDSLEAKKRSFNLEKEARDKLVANLAKTNITAPADGLVVYARQERGGRMGGTEPVGLGKEVREQEEILRIPDLSQMVVEVDIHESSIKKVKQGQRVWVKVDALPNEIFPGVVTRVSLVPSTQGSWMNPDLKVYETVVKLEKTVEGVKPGMHAQVEIQVAELDNVLQVPLQAVRQSGAKSFVYVKTSGGPELREVKVGQNSASSIEIQDGIKEGELVYLAPPAGAPALPAPEAAAPTFEETGNSAANGAAPGGPRPFDDGNMPPGAPGAGGRQGGGAPGENGAAGGGASAEERRRQMAERMKNMTPEEQQKFREEMMRRRGGGDGSGGRGGRGNRGGERGGEQNGGGAGGGPGGERQGPPPAPPAGGGG